MALTRLQLAELLLQHHQGERSEALEHLDFVIPEFRDMKMHPSLERALRLKMEVQGISSAETESSIGTVTPLFTDIEGSTALNECLGDQRRLELLCAHNAYEVKTEGDQPIDRRGHASYHGCTFPSKEASYAGPCAER